MMRGDIRAYQLDEPTGGNTWAWEVALNDDGAKVAGFASTEESAMRQAEYACGLPGPRRVPAAWVEHAHLAPHVAVALQTTADRLGVDLIADYDLVRDTVTDLREYGYTNRQIGTITPGGPLDWPPRKVWLGLPENAQ